MEISDLDKYKALQPDASYPFNQRRFYSPIDRVHNVLVDIVASCRASIIVAMYGYDDDELASMIDKLLIQANVYAQITLDKSQAAGTHEKAILAKYKNTMEGNSVAIGTSEKGAIMHRKMMIVDGIWVVTGSTNWSTSGESLQDNELTVTKDAVVAAEARHILDLEHTKALKALAVNTTRAIINSYERKS